MTDMAATAERVRLLTETARQLLASGADATGLGLGDAKWVVHRNLSPEVREAAENLWDDLLDGLRQFQEPPSEPDPTR